jgi:hypothetical protein
MKKTNQRLLTLAAAAMLLSGTAYAAEPQAARSEESTSASAKHAVKPHNHMRDAKGMGIGDMHTSATKKASSAETEKDAAGKPAEAAKQEEHKKKGVKPHNHPRDAKGA